MKQSKVDGIVTREPSPVASRRRSQKKAAGASLKTKTKTRTGKGKRGNVSLAASAEDAKPQYGLTDKLLNLYRPLKKPVTMRVDADVLAWFKQGARHYQTRINRALREVMVREMKKQDKEGR